MKKDFLTRYCGKVMVMVAGLVAAVAPPGTVSSPWVVVVVGFVLVVNSSAWLVTAITSKTVSVAEG